MKALYELLAKLRAWAGHPPQGVGMAIASNIKVPMATLAPGINTTQGSGIMQRWQGIRHELIPELELEGVLLIPKLEKMVNELECCV